MAVSMSMPILIVDDYNTMIRIVRSLLRQLGFSNIDEASDANTALGKMRAKQYGLVISDRDLAPMTGPELMQRARGEARSGETPFLMVANDTGEAPDESAEATTTILKPFNAQALKSKLVAVLGAF